ncbi:hypothetical protein J4402_04405 [Candidatus Pacearchaeota archaeon]|nr:hypothetical protein [Candidatus Pacearchaeota archaeon]
MTKDTEYWLMDIKDKISLRKGNCCPPHRLPHTLPIIGELVKDEPCHYHNSKLRMLHHRFFCRMLGCPYYEEMIRRCKEPN